LPPSVAAADAGGSDAGTPQGALQVEVQNRAVTLRWEEDEWQFHCLTLRQNRADKAKPVEGVFCVKKSTQTTLTIGDNPAAPGVDFSWSAVGEFGHGPATWKLRGGTQYGLTPNDVAQGTLTLGPHFNGPCSGAGATATGLTEWHAKAPVKLDIAVVVSVAARQNVDIATPEIWIDSVTAKGSPAPGGTLAFSYTFDTPGMYTVEVNNQGGGAILNCAVYVGAAVPLIPVEITGGAGLSGPPSPTQLAAMRKKLLDLTNQERETVGLGPLVLDDKLNEIAQYHSQQMADENFFGHTDKKGMGPGERAKLHGFAGPVGENIASNGSVEGAHNGLYWSAAHRSNMLGKTWGRAGFGFAKGADSKNILVTENFSTP